jgi:hypothetical protein
MVELLIGFGMEGEAVGQKWDYPRTIPAKFGLIWFSGFREEDLNVIFYQNMPTGMVLGWVSFKIVSDRSALHSRWLLLLKIEISSIVHCCFIINQNELKL